MPTALYTDYSFLHTRYTPYCQCQQLFTQTTVFGNIRKWGKV